MQWWGWVIVALVVIALLVGAFIAIQARRRKGGVIVDPAGPATTDGGRKP